MVLAALVAVITTLPELEVVVASQAASSKPSLITWEKAWFDNNKKQGLRISSNFFFIQQFLVVDGMAHLVEYIGVGTIGLPNYSLKNA